MPTKRKFNKKTIKKVKNGKTYKKLNKISKYVGYQPKKIVGFPITQIVKMQLNFTETLTLLDNGQAAYLSVNANNINSPFPAKPRPMGYDQWQQFYRNFAVVSSHMEARIIPSIESDVKEDRSGAIVGIRLTRDNAFDPSNGLDMLSTGQTGRYKVMSSNNAQQTTIIRNGYNAKKWFGIKDFKDNLNTLGNPYGSGGSNGGSVFYQLYMNNLDVTQPGGSYDFLVTVTYYVYLFNIKDMATQSLP